MDKININGIPSEEALYLLSKLIDRLQIKQRKYKDIIKQYKEMLLDLANSMQYDITDDKINAAEGMFLKKDIYALKIERTARELYFINQHIDRAISQASF